MNLFLLLNLFIILFLFLFFYFFLAPIIKILNKGLGE